MIIEVLEQFCIITLCGQMIYIHCYMLTKVCYIIIPSILKIQSLSLFLNAHHHQNHPLACWSLWVALYIWIVMVLIYVLTRFEVSNDCLLVVSTWWIGPPIIDLYASFSPWSLCDESYLGWQWGVGPLIPKPAPLGGTAPIPPLHTRYGLLSSIP